MSKIRFDDGDPNYNHDRRRKASWRDGPVRLWIDTSCHKYEILYLIDGKKLLFCDDCVVERFPATKATRRLLEADESLRELIRFAQSPPTTKLERLARMALLEQVAGKVKAMNDGR